MSKDAEMQEMYDKGWSKAAEYFRPALRDKFAIAALPVIYKDYTELARADPESIAKDAYSIADARLEARK